MDKKVLNEISTIKKMMGIVNEQIIPDFPKEKIPKGCPQNGECFFYIDGVIYKRKKNGYVGKSKPKETRDHLEDLGVLGVLKVDCGKNQSKTGNAMANNYINSLLKYNYDGGKNSFVRDCYGNFDRGDAVSALIVPWKQNAKTAIIGLPIFSYTDETVYLGSNDETLTPDGVTQVTEPSVSNED